MGRWAAEQVRKWAGEQVGRWAGEQVQVMTAYVGAWCSSLLSLRAALYCTTVVAQSA